MYLELMAALTVGFGAGAGSMFWYQRKMRMKELSGIAAMSEDIINGKKAMASSVGEETMAARIAHQMVRVQEILSGAKEDAQKSRDEIQKLISEIAHQMRTPLANIKTYLGFLKEDLEKRKEGEEGTERKEYVSALEESGKKLHFLVESFVSMSRLEQKIIQVRKDETDLLKTVRNALGQIQSRAEEKNIQFDIVFPEEAVCGHDPNWLGEAIYNLLDNGVKYSRQGRKIEVSVGKSEMFAKLRVRDYGIGIEEGEENQIFRRFYRGRRVTNQEGLGIGLYLAREIVALHGGFITVKRMPQGLLAEIDLPL